MENNLVVFIKVTIKDLIVALLIGSMLLVLVNLFYGQEIDTAFTLINTVSINKVNNIEKTAVLDSENKILKEYPQYGQKYASIQIPKIKVDLPVYFGATLEILKNGVGHDSGSYFPGEGGSIIYMGHNSKEVFRDFSKLQIGSKIIVTTDYGTFNYKIYDMKVIQETQVDALPIQKEKEILMIYTCYPLNNIGYASQRYVVYAELTN